MNHRQQMKGKSAWNSDDQNHVTEEVYLSRPSLSNLIFSHWYRAATTNPKVTESRCHCDERAYEMSGVSSR